MKQLYSMMRFLSALSLVFSLSCSSDSSDSPPDDPTPVLPTLTTQAPTFNNGKIQFHGNIVSLGDGYYSRGFCWSNNTNPTTDDEYVYADGSGTGPYFKEEFYTAELVHGQTYNVRAFASTSGGGGTVYGNNITFTLPDEYTFTTQGAYNIYSNNVELFANVTANDTGVTSITNKGFCISTNPTPTVSNSDLVYQNSPESVGSYSLVVGDLTKNTTYYVRSFGYNGSSTTNAFYGNIISFKTTGYLGASGGYVFFDKGQTTDGWRYLEAAPSDVTYNSSTLIKWGCTGSSITTTSLNVGQGLENTNNIVASCSDANCAARICYDYSINGLSDWFLPSKNELIILDNSATGVFNLGNSTNQVHWSSSEYNSSNAHFINTYYGSSIGSGISKNNACLVRPIRRF